MSRKLEILQTALKLFNETNTQAATTNHIAKAMGISPGNLHYHYKNREEIIFLLYKQKREKMTLSVDKLPQNLAELNEHQKLLINIQWEYRFFFKEKLFLFSKDKELERVYIKDNLAHRSRIKIAVENFIRNGEIKVIDNDSLEYIVDSILMSWQFYTSYMHTLGRGLDIKGAQEVLEHTNNVIKPFLTPKAQAHNKASEWFNDLYKKHKDNHDNIPWARLAVNPLLESYLSSKDAHKGKALVIGCGLGDDAKALEVAGYDVLAIDVSEVALDLAKERFNDSKIVFEKQDIFDMPPKYQGYFDFVFEAFTIQSLPREFREKMIRAVSKTVAPQGELLLIAHKKEKEFDGPPWPLEKNEIDLFKTHGLKELLFDIHEEESKISDRKFRVLYVNT